MGFEGFDDSVFRVGVWDCDDVGGGGEGGFGGCPGEDGDFEGGRGEEGGEYVRAKVSASADDENVLDWGGHVDCMLRWRIFLCS